MCPPPTGPPLLELAPLRTPRFRTQVVAVNATSEAPSFLMFGGVEKRLLVSPDVWQLMEGGPPREPRRTPPGEVAAVLEKLRLQALRGDDDDDDEDEEEEEEYDNYEDDEEEAGGGGGEGEAGGGGDEEMVDGGGAVRVKPEPQERGG